MGNSVLSGVVVNDICDKTISVLVASKVWHKTYKKLINVKKKYLVHDPSNDYSAGDLVAIRSSVPISARKKWIVVRDA